MHTHDTWLTFCLADLTGVADGLEQRAAAVTLYSATGWLLPLHFLALASSSSSLALSPAEGIKNSIYCSFLWVV
jgi:hypothetical protein